MPRASEHQVKAENNRQFLSSIPVDSFPEWAVTVAFYAAVHSIERIRAASNEGHSQGHGDRLAYIANSHPSIYSPYLFLQNASMLARYYSRSDFFRQFQPTDVQQRLIEENLVAIIQYVESRMGP